VQILLITHDTSLSGAPKSILLIFEQLKARGYNIVTFAIKGDGALKKRFEDLSVMYFDLQNFPNSKNYSFYNRIKRILLNSPILSPFEQILTEISKIDFDFIYVNTVVCLRLGLEIKHFLNVKLILHIHELTTVIDEFYPSLSETKNSVYRYLVPSYMNKDCLVNDYCIPSDLIFVLREPSDAKKTKLLVKSKVVNVLMCGGAYWRKGDDLFILIAKYVLSIDDRFRFYWLGSISEERKRVNLADIKKIGIENHLFFIGEKEDVGRIYSQSNIFALTSREDPFPLAAIDAGMYGLPIVCFENATGISEIISKEYIIPYLDVISFSNILLDYFNFPEKFIEEGLKNQMRFNNFTPELISNDLEKILINE
jgi:glycosyltransferase involved in cell wall biosynthesis